MKHSCGLCAPGSFQCQMLRTFLSKVRGDSVMDFLIIFSTRSLSNDNLKATSDITCPKELQ